MKLLIVDDDSTSRIILEKILASLPDCQVTSADNGSDAWAILDDPARSFDVVFLDLSMPGPDGFELIGRIRKAPLLKSLEIVITTGANDRSTVGKAIARGVRHYIVKPCTQAVIIAKLQQIKPTLALPDPA
ncbi:MAG TPA: response regulator [Opitutus sp.]|nr:response regulator [Opitutus sp.]